MLAVMRELGSQDPQIRATRRKDEQFGKACRSALNQSYEHLPQGKLVILVGESVEHELGDKLERPLTMLVCLRCVERALNPFC